jgi:eukaryotic-like serine/threonine-protein kinase
MSESVLGGRYRLEARIGAGGMAEVFRGFDTVLNRTVAIKTLNAPFARDASFVERFRREAQAAARLSHPNIVATYDSGTDGDTQYIVMEFIEGRTLAEFLGSGKTLTPDHATQVAGEVCNALTVAHTQGVIHRDIKPGNIMVTRDGSVKVMDFGIARLVSGPETAPQTSVVMGTATYISPEQAKGQAVDARSDIYSLGAVLYEMLAGRPPFVGESSVAVAYKQVNEVPEPPSAHHPEVPAALDAVVMRALAKNPANRYPDAAAFGADLARARSGQPVEATPLLPLAGDATQVISRPRSTQILPPMTDPPGSGRKVWLGIVIGVLVVAIIAGAGILLANGLLGGNPSPSAQIKPMPTLVNLGRAAAETALSKAGFTGKVTVNEQISKLPAGTVIAQDPIAGTPTSTDAAITLTVAKAAKEIPVPNLSTMTEAEARAALTAVHLKLGPVTSAPSDNVPVGQVVSQDPTPDTPVARNSTVSIVISSGPASATVLDVVCLPYGSAKAKLQQDFVVVDGGPADSVNASCPAQNRVAAQSPGPGPAPAGSTVTLYTNPPPSPTPSTTPTP